jgi:uncharacterized protein YoxC
MSKIKMQNSSFYLLKNKIDFKIYYKLILLIKKIIVSNMSHFSEEIQSILKRLNKLERENRELKNENKQMKEDTEQKCNILQERIDILTDVTEELNTENEQMKEKFCDLNTNFKYIITHNINTNKININHDDLGVKILINLYDDIKKSNNFHSFIYNILRDDRISNELVKILIKKICKNITTQEKSYIKNTVLPDLQRLCICLNNISANTRRKMIQERINLLNDFLF